MLASVTGGCGCVGSHVTDHLLRASHEVRASTVARSGEQQRNYVYVEDLAEGVGVSDSRAKELPDWSPETSCGAGPRRDLDWPKETG